MQDSTPEGKTVQCSAGDADSALGEGKSYEGTRETERK